MKARNLAAAGVAALGALTSCDRDGFQTGGERKNRGDNRQRQTPNGQNHFHGW